jgi:hypothetical protein
LNKLLEHWAMVNTIVIMLALGMAYRPLHVAVIARAAIGYNFVFPALGLMLLASFTTWFGAETLTALSLCIAAAGGTSAGAFVKKSGTSATFATALTATLLIVLLGLSLGVIAVLTVTGKLDFGALSLSALCGYLLLITLVPFGVGILLARQWPLISHRWQPRMERTGSVLVLLLIVGLLWRYGAEILGGPAEPLWAAAVLVTLLVLPPLLLERQPLQKRTLVLTTLIRNLTLVLSLLIMPHAAQLLPTVLAFGLLMYLLSGILALLL